LPLYEPVYAGCSQKMIGAAGQSQVEIGFDPTSNLVIFLYIPVRLIEQVLIAVQLVLE